MTCPSCEDQKIVSPVFLDEVKNACAQLTVDLIVFCKKNKINHNEIPILPEIARLIRILESL